MPVLSRPTGEDVTSRPEVVRCKPLRPVGVRSGAAEGQAVELDGLAGGAGHDDCEDPAREREARQLEQVLVDGRRARQVEQGDPGPVHPHRDRTARLAGRRDETDPIGRAAGELPPRPVGLRARACACIENGGRAATPVR